MVRFVTALWLSAACALPALAAEGGVVPTLVQHWKTSKQYLVALAEQMPAEDYAFKPNAAEMGFGEQMAHIAGANSFFFSKVSGKKDPIGKPANFEKATVLKMLNDSYDFCISALEGMEPARLHEMIDTGEGKMAGLEALMLAAPVMQIPARG